MIVLPDTLWASLPVPALLIGRDDRIEDANPAAEQFMNASARVLRGQPFLDKLTVDAPLKDALARVRGDGTALFVNDVSVSAGKRAPFYCTLQIAPLGGDADHILLLISSHEISDRLERAHSVKASAKSAIGMAEMLAHEIKNPLAGITGAAQLLSMSLADEDRELTDLIVAESRRIVALLDQVEQFGNVQPPARQAINIHDLLERARKSAAVGYAAHMKITEEYDPSLPYCWGDPDQLLQVVLNLLKNAAEANPDGGTIRLRTFYDHSLRLRRAEGGGLPLPLTIEVTDDGPGLPPAIAANIFDPFVSGHENGRGLGLALVSKIISDHEGAIGVETSPGCTTFRISLPRAPDDTHPKGA